MSRFDERSAWNALRALRGSLPALAGFDLDGAPTPLQGAAVQIDAEGKISGPATDTACELIGRLHAVACGKHRVVAQLAQTLDGFIATGSGESRYISGEASLVHLHQLRALVDVVLVGRVTVQQDDPRLTVRHVPGPCPARAVIDLHHTLRPRARWLEADGAACVVLRRPGGGGLGRAKALAVAGTSSADPKSILEALRGAGYDRVLIEGGGKTVTSFVEAGVVDRLHLSVAPLFLGEGRRGLALQPAARLEDARRPRVRTCALGEDTLYDCDLSEAAAT